MSNKNNNITKYIVLSVLGVLSMVCLYFFLTRHVYSELSERGLFGDSFGAFNAIFAALAFTGIIIAIFLQRRELEVQQQELSDTREVLKLQQEQFKSQSETLSLQRFETTFFNLINHLNRTIDDIPQIRERFVLLNVAMLGSGRESFHIALKSLKTGRKVRALSTKDTIKLFNESLGFNFLNYFETLFNILMYLDKSTIDNKSFYFNLVKSSLNESCKVITFYRIAFQEAKYFKELVKKNNFFMDINKQLLFEESDFELIYKNE